MTVSSYEKYRNAQIEDGRIFQDFVVDACWSMLGLAIVQYSSRLYQQTVGESRTGAEIKHDKKFKETGNLWIEVSEKARPRPGDYFPSGIKRDDNTWLYIIGDYDTLFVFSKTLLNGLYASGRYRTLQNNTQTSEGFLLPAAHAEKYASCVIRPNAEDKVSAAIHDLELLGKTLHQMALQHPDQASLIGI